MCNLLSKRKHDSASITLKKKYLLLYKNAVSTTRLNWIKLNPQTVFLNTQSGRERRSLPPHIPPTCVSLCFNSTPLLWQQSTKALPCCTPGEAPCVHSHHIAGVASLKSPDPVSMCWEGSKEWETEREICWQHEGEQKRALGELQMGQIRGDAEGKMRKTNTTKGKDDVKWQPGILLISIYRSRVYDTHECSTSNSN